MLSWPNLPTPVAFGVFRPTVAIPHDFSTRWSRSAQEAMLGHEVTHLAASDPAWMLFADITVAALCWHPAVWLSRRRLRAANECAADVVGAAAAGGPLALADAIVCSARDMPANHWCEALAIFGSGLRPHLAVRIVALLRHDGSKPRVRPTRLWLTRSAALCAATVLMFSACPAGEGAGLVQTALTAAFNSASGRGADTAPRTSEPAERVSPNVPAPQAPLTGGGEEEALGHLGGQPGQHDLNPPAVDNDADRQAGLSTDSETDRPASSGGSRVATNFVPCITYANTESASPRPAAEEGRRRLSVAYRGRVAEAFGTGETERLVTRQYPLLMAFVDALRPYLPPAVESTDGKGLERAVRRFCEANGFNGLPAPAPPKDRPPDTRPAYYNKRAGILFARATPDELSRLEQHLDEKGLRQGDHGSSPTPKPEVLLSIEFLEVTEGGGDDLGLDWLFGRTNTNNPAIRDGARNGAMDIEGMETNTNLRIDELLTRGESATLTAKQFSALRARLMDTHRAAVTAAPKVQTGSGKAAQVAIVQSLNVVSGVTAQPRTTTNQPTIQYATQPISVGTTLDVLPVFGEKWRLEVKAKVSEFLGYDDPGTNLVSVAEPGVAPVTGTVPKPHFRVRIVEATGEAAPGETMVVRGPLVQTTLVFRSKVPVLGDIPLLGRMFRDEKRIVQPKRLYVFVTPERAPVPQAGGQP